jgi:2,3-bisphosphoglycerate-independent phosphoglycerate mutase
MIFFIYKKYHLKKTPLVLAILDGFGLGKKEKNNGIHLASPQFINMLFEKHGFSELKASGKAVGLPEGQIGNSEVGHITIGSGRIVYQDLMRINNEIHNKEFDKKFSPFIESIQKKNNVCHVIGLLSNGGVHSHEDHAIYSIKLLLKNNIKVFGHFFLDGRDVGTFDGLQSIKKILKEFESEKNFQCATISGRFFGMDRDNRWEKTKKAFNAIFEGIGEKTLNFIQSIKGKYNINQSDEFLEPLINENYQGFQENDSIFTFNWRSDRMRQISQAIGDKNFIHFERKNFCMNLLSMAEYSKEISQYSQSLYQKELMKNGIGEILAQNNLKQLRIAETEKYAHVTFFFDGGIEKKIKNCDSILISSNKSVKTYDQCPEMSAYEIVHQLIENSQKYDVFIVNFANLDMVGHTGNIEAIIQSVKVVDECIKKLYKEFVENLNGTLIITSDHGNADEMFDLETNEIKTAHTLNNVPFCIIRNDQKFSLKNGSLSDIAPTILAILEIEKPQEMNGENLILNI